MIDEDPRVIMSDSTSRGTFSITNVDKFYFYKKDNVSGIKSAHFFFFLNNKHRIMYNCMFLVIYEEHTRLIEVVSYYFTQRLIIRATCGQHKVILR